MKESKKPGYRSYKGMKEPGQFADHLERLNKKFYDKVKGSSVKPLVDPKKSRIPGVSRYLKRK